MKILDLANSSSPVIVDDEDADLFEKHWVLVGKGLTQHVRESFGSRYLQRVVASRILGREITKTERVAFRDGNSFNCTRKNLSITGKVTEVKEFNPQDGDTPVMSEIEGVLKHRGRFYPCRMVDGQWIPFARFDTLKEAEDAKNART